METSDRNSRGAKATKLTGPEWRGLVGRLRNLLVARGFGHPAFADLGLALSLCMKGDIHPADVVALLDDHSMEWLPLFLVVAKSPDKYADNVRPFHEFLEENLKPEREADLCRLRQLAEDVRKQKHL